MNRRNRFAFAGLAVVVVAGGSIALARHQDPPGQDIQLPPGWTEADMQACMEAATPGENHEFLAKGVGTWHGKTKMWMAPDAPPVESTCTMTIEPVFDGRYFECEWSGDMGGMPFLGKGIYAFDNVSQTFQSTWIDNCGTGIAVGEGERSSDGTMTWKYTYNCPINKKPTYMREVETPTGENSRTLVMYTVDPKSGREYKMMEIEFTRKPSGTRTGSVR